MKDPGERSHADLDPYGYDEVEDLGLVERTYVEEARIEDDDPVLPPPMTGTPPPPAQADGTDGA